MNTVAIFGIISILIILFIFIIFLNKTHDTMTEEEFDKAMKFNEKISQYRYIIFILLGLSLLISYFMF